MVDGLQAAGQEDGSPLYNEFPPITVGGVSGQYVVEAPVKSSRWVEYSIVAISSGDAAGQYVAQISGKAPVPTAQVKYDGSINYNGADGTGDSSLQGVLSVRMTQTQTLFPITRWFRVTSSERRVYITLTVPNSSTMLVGIQFRDRVIERIPGPAKTVHPDHSHEMNIDRAGAISSNLEKMGIPAYAHKGDTDKD